MNAPLRAPLALSAGAGARGVERSLGEAAKLLVAAEAHALVLAELGQIELPAAERAEPTQLRAVASLYLASTLEAAGLIEAADDFVRLARSGGLPADLGQAGTLVNAFWGERNSRPTGDERLALFSRLFGAPAGPVDARAPVNAEFEGLLLDLCDAITEAIDGGSQGRVRAAGLRLMENIGASADGMVLMMAREIIDCLGQAIAILNHPQVRTALMARTMWDAVGAIDRRFRRPARPTLSHLRRGRAGMAVLAWLADVAENLDRGGGPIVSASDSVVDEAVNWVDETLSILRAEEPAGASPAGRTPQRTEPAWLDLAR
jgi:hypothetical protein